MNVNPVELMALWEPTFGLVRSRMRGESHADAEDIVAEAILRTVKADPLLDARPNALRNFLYTVALRLLINLRRRQGVVAFVPLLDTDRERGCIDAGSDRQAAMLDLAAALDALPRDERLSVCGRAEGLPDDVIAASFGRGKTCLYRRLKYGRLKLKRSLGAVHAR
jgi:DNA-directed RNA polymerase specialized sigma24 family protein